MNYLSIYFLFTAVEGEGGVHTKETCSFQDSVLKKLQRAKCLILCSGTIMYTPTYLLYIINNINIIKYYYVYDMNK